MYNKLFILRCGQRDQQTTMPSVNEEKGCQLCYKSTRGSHFTYLSPFIIIISTCFVTIELLVYCSILNRLLLLFYIKLSVKLAIKAGSWWLVLSHTNL